MKQIKKKPSPNIKRSVLSAAFTLLFIAAIVVVNVIVWVISDRIDMSADLTAYDIYTLDEATEKFLAETLSTDVEITVLNTEQAFENQDAAYKQVGEILKKMAMQSEHVSVRFLNINQNPNYTSKFKGETLAEDYIIFECAKTGRYKILSPFDYFTFNEAMQYYNALIIESSQIEQQAVSALMYTTSEKLVKVAFAEGYSESDGSDALKTLLTNSGYEVQSLPLVTTPEIGADIDFVVLYAPLLDIDKEQLAKLDKYLYNNGEYGKNVVYFASTRQPKTPNLDEFLSDYGLKVGFDVIGQSDESHLISAATAYAHLQSICDTEYTKNVHGSRLLTYGIETRPVYSLDSNATVLMKSFDGAFLFPLDTEEAKTFDYDKAERGAFNSVVISEKSGSRVCAIGSEYLASSAVMSYSNSANADFFVGMFDYIAGREEGVVIKPKSMIPAVFDMSVKTANALSIVLCVIIPIAVITLGIVIWLRRRHR